VEKLVYESRHSPPASPPASSPHGADTTYEPLPLTQVGPDDDCDPGPSCAVDFEPTPESVQPNQGDFAEHEQPADKPEHKDMPTSVRRGLSSAASFDIIIEMLQEAGDLSHNIPTTADRLSRISGLFPEGHGPSVEVVAEQSQNETQQLNSFRAAISSMLLDLTEFRLKQDAVCSGYEQEAAIIEQQIREQDAGATSPNVNLDSVIYIPAGLSEAEVLFLYLFVLSYLFILLSSLFCFSFLGVITSELPYFIIHRQMQR